MIRYQDKCVEDILREGEIDRSSLPPSLSPPNIQVLMKKLLALEKKRSTCRAFSLVEVTLALGLVGFGMVSMMGLLPSGLTTFREAMDRTLSAQIVQAVLNEYQLTDYSSLPTGPVTSYYDADGQTVDANGNPVTAKTGKYRVEVGFEVAELPGGARNPDMQRIQIIIFDQASGRILRGFSSMLAKRTR